MSSAAAEAETARARPLSGGLWTLLSWLRRDDAGSSDSLSSIGSDRTAASFSFLAPDRCRQRAAPLLRAPPLPTDSYRNRLRDRNLRIQHDRDLTLHRKYGLFRGENSGHDAFSLPSARKVSGENKEWADRERRAASECERESLQRRAAHVPGKRRAPPPPARAATLAAPRRSRKRPAPQPPRRPLSEAILNDIIPEPNILNQMSAKFGRDEPLAGNDAPDCKPEKYIKKEVKDPKIRTEKSFLKQIFESRKRNSTVDTVPERILPSISELDKQAYEIIESCKLTAFNEGNESSRGDCPELQMRSKGDMWYCTRCLRKYNDSVVTCVHCVTEQKNKLNKNDHEKHSASNHYTQTEIPCVPSTSRVTEAEEKQKLKEMLKEIKDSLPKRPKHDMRNNPTNITTTLKAFVVDAPTLRIGSKTKEQEKNANFQNKDVKLKNYKAETDHEIKASKNMESSSATERAVVSQPIVLQHSPSRDIIKLENFKVSNPSNDGIKIRSSNATDTEIYEAPYNNNPSPRESNTHTASNENKFSSEPLSDNINTPLKISSLFNSQLFPDRLLLGSFSQTETHNQPQIEINAQSSNYNPILTNNIPTGTVLNSPHSLSTIAPSGSPKVVQPVQKTRATTTTQTSEVLMDIATKQKQTATRTKELTNTEVMKTKTGQLDTNAHKNQTLINNSEIVLNPSASCLSGASASIIATPPHKPITNKEPKAEDILNLNVKIKDDKITDQLQKPASKMLSGLSKLEASDQRLPATKIISLDQHLKRRDLINQLEQSIAKGDERAAAEAAAKLAQLRLSCSVLSFSSQIVCGASTSNAMSEKNNVSNNTHITQHVATPTTIKSQVRITDKLQNASASTSITLADKEIIPAQFQSKYCEKKRIPQAHERQPPTEEPSTSKSNGGLRKENDIVSIEVWIEDKEAARGPIKMNMPRTSVVGDLRRHADTTLGLAAKLQRWIVGRTLCTNDNTPLNALAGPGFDAPFYLCLVEPETSKQPASHLRESPALKEENKNVPSGKKLTNVYNELVLLERRALVPNAEEFECGVCMETYRAGEGTVLRECVHTFCRECLSDVVKHCEEPAVCCPAMGCPGTLQEREIRALVSPEEYERWLARGLAAAESGTRNAFHCRTRDCSGWALCEPGVTRFPCPVCKRTNCVTCQAIHEGETCEQYRVKQASEVGNQGQAQTDEGTRAFLDTLISRGEALECPECSAIITKKWGCDWIKCSACKTEICWVTRGRRWGPAGRGDTSAGCRCGVDGKRCHPSCGYCH